MAYHSLSVGLYLLALWIICGCVVPLSEAAPAKVLGWNCVDHFEGFWLVEKISDGTTENCTFNFTRTAFDGVLLGVYNTTASPHSDQRDHPLTLKITSHSAMEGSFSIESSIETEEEEEEDLGEDVPYSSLSGSHTVLTLGFQFQSTRSGISLSQGRYRRPISHASTDVGSYSFLIPGKDQFVLILEEKEDPVVFIGRRAVKAVETSFFQKFGPTIMIIVVFVGSKLVAYKFQSKRPPLRRASHTPTVPSPSTAQDSSKTK